eukprot:scaffold1821_cov344-Pavlova_lutheri.AAC.27
MRSFFLCDRCTRAGRTPGGAAPPPPPPKKDIDPIRPKLSFIDRPSIDTSGRPHRSLFSPPLLPSIHPSIDRGGRERRRDPSLPPRINLRVNLDLVRKVPVAFHRAKRHRRHPRGWTPSPRDMEGPKGASWDTSRREKCPPKEVRVQTGNREEDVAGKQGRNELTDGSVDACTCSKTHVQDGRVEIEGNTSGKSGHRTGDGRSAALRRGFRKDRTRSGKVAGRGRRRRIRDEDRHPPKQVRQRGGRRTRRLHEKNIAVPGPSQRHLRRAMDRSRHQAAHGFWRSIHQTVGRGNRTMHRVLSRTWRKRQVRGQPSKRRRKRLRLRSKRWSHHVVGRPNQRELQVLDDRRNVSEARGKSRGSTRPTRDP